MYMYKAFEGMLGERERESQLEIKQMYGGIWHVMNIYIWHHVHV